MKKKYPYYTEKTKSPREFAKAVRYNVALINNATRDSHIGGGYSAIDIIAVLYTRIMNYNLNNILDPSRDIFILSKGHIATTMYATLAQAGVIPFDELDQHLENGGTHAGHIRKWSTNGVRGIEMSSGSLGHGASVGCGMAYAKRQQGFGGNVFVLMGDGECNEGSVWESIMFAARFKLNNLVLIIDRNHLQAYGRDEQVLNMGNMVDKINSFGCQAIEINGHDYDDIETALSEAISKHTDKPTVIVANTIKGFGIPFMENKLEWHFKSPDDEQLDIIRQELGFGE